MRRHSDDGNHTTAAKNVALAETDMKNAVTQSQSTFRLSKVSIDDRVCHDGGSLELREQLFNKFETRRYFYYNYGNFR